MEKTEIERNNDMSLAVHKAWTKYRDSEQSGRRRRAIFFSRELSATEALKLFHVVVDLYQCDTLVDKNLNAFRYDKRNDTITESKWI